MPDEELEEWAQHDYYYAGKSGKPPSHRPPCLGIMFFSAPQYDPAVANDINALRTMLKRLHAGKVGRRKVAKQENTGPATNDEEPEEYHVEEGVSFFVRFGLGRFMALRLFPDVQDAWLGDQNFRESAEQGREIFPGAKLSFTEHVKSNPAYADAMLQFTAESMDIINLVMFEVARELEYRKSSIKLKSAFTGVGRGPRNILGFYDGKSNTPPSERGQFIELDGPNGLERSTFLAFIRMRLNMQVWPSRMEERERWIGRTLQDGNLIQPDGSPFAIGTDENKIDSKSVFADSHVSVVRDGNLKIFRQGYEFQEFDYHDRTAAPVVGLNFISFQNKPDTICSLLKNMNSSFSPLADAGPAPFATADAAGIFFVPSREALQKLFNSIPSTYKKGTYGTSYDYEPRAIDIARALRGQEPAHSG